jgi:hypothetical protein
VAAGQGKLSLVRDQRTVCTENAGNEGKGCSGTPVVGFRFAKTEFLSRVTWPLGVADNV